ncbi:MAG: hypothetical protein ACYDA6_10365 [Solirubrobacteraceae bacterium]
MKIRTLVTAGACAAMTMCAALALLGGIANARPASHGARTPIDIRVEGAKKTLLAETALNVEAERIDPDGKPADTCEGATAAAALQEATRGDWAAGAYYSGLGYSVAGIIGESHPFSSPYYWSFWVDGKTSTTGICSVKLQPHMHLLFFVQCSQQSAAQCPEGLFEPPVLALSGPQRARAGKALTLRVSSLANATGKPGPGAGVTLTWRGGSATTNASGVAKVRLRKAGRYTIVATAAGAIRDELTVRVRG